MRKKLLLRFESELVQIVNVMYENRDNVGNCFLLTSAVVRENNVIFGSLFHFLVAYQ